MSRRQLLDAGIASKQVDRWVSDGRLRPVHRGVYAVGHQAPALAGDYMAAVLAGGAGAVISHRAAAHLMALLRGRPPRAEITVPTTADVGRPGIVIHRVSVLHRADTTTIDAIPITIAPRILLDLAPSTAPRQLTRICHEAWVRHRCGPDEIEACIARNPHKPGAGRLRRALGSDVTLSVLEDAFEDDVARRRRHVTSPTPTATSSSALRGRPPNCARGWRPTPPTAPRRSPDPGAARCWRVSTRS